MILNRKWACSFSVENFTYTTLHHNMQLHSYPQWIRSNHAEHALHDSIGLKFKCVVRSSVDVQCACLKSEWKLRFILRQRTYQQWPSRAGICLSGSWTQFARHRDSPNTLQPGVQVVEVPNAWGACYHILLGTCRGGACTFWVGTRNLHPPLAGYWFHSGESQWRVNWVHDPERQIRARDGRCW